MCVNKFLEPLFYLNDEDEDLIASVSVKSQPYN